MRENNLRKPPWIRVPRAEGARLGRVRRVLRDRRLATVCQEARCPNRGECWAQGTATFLLLGEQCTRSCRFCSVRPGRRGEPLDRDEPRRVARAAAELGLRYVVLTSVSRDDLEDGGASHYGEAVRALRQHCPGVKVEVLIPDYQGAALATLLAARPDVLAHNLEVVRSLTRRVRDRRCSYDRSLAVLRQVKEVLPDQVTKSSLLLGLGEGADEIEATLDDLRQCGVDILCLGQYLQPSRDHYPVADYLPPARFAALADLARAKGFTQVASGPLVRTSYHAEELAASLGSPAPRAVLQEG